eukprot:339088-Pyramimonas_sp.AAC.1
MISGMRKALRRRAALWSPFKKTLKLQGLKLPDEDHGLRVVDARQDVQAELHRHWSPIFQHKEIPIDIANKYLDRYSVLMDFSSASIPDDRQLARAAGAARDSAAGPDGMPCAAWAKSPRALRDLADVARAISMGHPPSDDWNDHLMVFLPKGKEDSDLQT